MDTNVQLSRSLQRAAPSPIAEPDYDVLWRKGRRKRTARMGLALAATTSIVVLGVMSIQTGLFSEVGEGKDSPGTGSSRVVNAPKESTFLAAITDDEPSAPTIVSVDIETGEALPVEVDFAPGDAQIPLAVVGADLVYLGPGGVFAIPLGLDSAPRALGEAAYFVPARQADHVWLAHFAESTTTDGVLGRLQEVRVNDRSVIREVTLPEGQFSNLLGEASNGLVFEGNGGIKVWTPSTQQTVLELDDAFPLALNSSLIAWCQPTGCPESVMVTSVASNETLSLDAPSGYQFTAESGSALSPDGRYLVTTVTDDSGTRRLAIFDLVAQSMEVLPVDLGDGPLTWSPDSARLFVLGRRSELVSYDPTTRATRSIAVDLPSSVFAISAAPQ